MLNFGSNNLIIPIIMVILGLVFKFIPPHKINSVYGYRTTRSNKSQETWDYAQKRIGGLWLYMGAILYCISIISMIVLPVSKAYTSIIYGGIGIIAFLSGIPFVEKKLKEKFDENGNLKK